MQRLTENVCIRMISVYLIVVSCLLGHDGDLKHYCGQNNTEAQTPSMLEYYFISIRERLNSQMN